MKIAYCIPSTYNTGGMERILSLKANYMRTQWGWDVTIITTDQKGREAHFPLAEGIHQIDLGINYEDSLQCHAVKQITNRIKKKHLHRKRLSSLLLQSNFDIVVSMVSNEFSILPKIKDGSAKIAEIHFCKEYRKLDLKYHRRSRVRRLIGLIQDKLDERHASRYDAFVTLTEQDAASWRKLKNLHVIPNPCPTFGPELPDYRAKEAIAVGRLCPQKGFDLLMKSWNLLPDRIKNTWSLRIYGNGPDLNYLQRLKDDLHLVLVKICHPTAQIFERMQESSLFLFSSLYEGFSLALSEAMAIGLPCVAFDCPCGPRELITSQEHGFLVPLGDVTSFAHSIEKMAQSEQRRAEVGQRGKEQIQREFAPTRIMEKWFSLFSELNNKR